MPRRTKKTKKKATLNSPLDVCEYEHIDRGVGVRINDPFHHVGLDATCVDVVYEYPTVNAMMFGGPKVLGPEAVEAVKEGLFRCRDKCVEIVDELQAHITSLEQDLQAVEDGTIHFDEDGILVED